MGQGWASSHATFIVPTSYDEVRSGFVESPFMDERGEKGLTSKFDIIGCRKDNHETHFISHC